MGLNTYIRESKHCQARSHFPGDHMPVPTGCAKCRHEVLQQDPNPQQQAGGITHPYLYGYGTQQQQGGGWAQPTGGYYGYQVSSITHGYGAQQEQKVGYSRAPQGGGWDYQVSSITHPTPGGYRAQQQQPAGGYYGYQAQPTPLPIVSSIGGTPQHHLYQPQLHVDCGLQLEGRDVRFDPPAPAPMSSRPQSTNAQFDPQQDLGSEELDAAAIMASLAQAR